jgi:hypothetical protein
LLAEKPAEVDLAKAVEGLAKPEPTASEGKETKEPKESKE